MLGVTVHRIKHAAEEIGSHRKASAIVWSDRRKVPIKLPSKYLCGLTHLLMLSCINKNYFFVQWPKLLCRLLTSQNTDKCLLLWDTGLLLIM